MHTLWVCTHHSLDTTGFGQPHLPPSYTVLIRTCQAVEERHILYTIKFIQKNSPKKTCPNLLVNRRLRQLIGSTLGAFPSIHAFRLGDRIDKSHTGRIVSSQTMELRAPNECVSMRSQSPLYLGLLRIRGYKRDIAMQPHRLTVVHSTNAANSYGERMPYHPRKVYCKSGM